MIGSAIGLVAYVLIPTAPPRLMGAGYVDALAQTASYGWWSGHASAPAGLGGLTNELAAMPSLHVGWTVWVAWAMWRYVQRTGHVLSVLYVAGTTLVVIATGNHWLLDAIMGAVVVAIGIVAASRLSADSSPASADSTPHGDVAAGIRVRLGGVGAGARAVLPGEVAISSLATNVAGLLPLLVLGLAVALGASAGDHLGYVIGRLSGPRLRGSRLIARLGLDRWDKASELMQAHGFWAILVSRLLPFVRTVMPAVAGAAHLRYPRFALASVLGAAVWSTVWVGAGAGLTASGLLDNPPLSSPWWLPLSSSRSS